MDDILQNQQTPDFSDIPSLGDTQGLENFLNAQTLAAQGIQVQQPAQQPVQQEQPAAQQPAQQSQQAQQSAQAQGVQQTQPNTNSMISLTPEQYQALLAGRAQGQQPQQQVAQQRPQTPVYTAQEQQFITRALAQGYSLQQINQFLDRQKGAQVNPMTEQRIAQIEQYLRTQEYKTAETAFVNKLTEFGNKWGLSEQDLVTFGNEALKNGINIAMGNVNLETVFRAIYPDQYAIRSRRMSPTTSSQIYGGTSIPESSRASASKLEDAYVDNFLRGAMPNQYAASIKK